MSGRTRVLFLLVVALFLPAVALGIGCSDDEECHEGPHCTPEPEGTGGSQPDGGGGSGG